ncbi:MAG: competence protein ComEC [Chthoniobacter sp.]|jgi:beta-lactamase superfamily II metal-dependent hydrolase|nr:competence protein ComEC [Chthoniobacter sp.]
MTAASNDKLIVTFMDVGWGDSILLESRPATGPSHFALIDSNDTLHERSSYLYLKRFFERRGITTSWGHTFEFVLLTHGHSDHASGLPRILSKFGATRFLYPSTHAPPTAHPILAQVLRYQGRVNSRLAHCQDIDQSTSLSGISFGAVQLDVLWPPRNHSDNDENNHSIVLSLTLGNVAFVLTGDATASMWPKIVSRLPANTRLLQAPHHGARNGTFNGPRSTPWLTHIANKMSGVLVALSSHTRPHNHPHGDVITALDNTTPPTEHFRTDRHLHLMFETDGSSVTTHYFHP